MPAQVAAGAYARQSPSCGTAARFTVALALLLLVAAAVRVAVSTRVLWYDEACTYWQARQSPLIEGPVSFSVLPTLTVKPLVGRWDAPWALRLPFLTLGVLSIALLALAVRRLEGDRAALVAAALLALSPYHVLYSTETRMYAYSLLAGAACFLCLVLALERDRPRLWVLYGVAGIVGMWAHPFIALLVVAHGCYLLLARRDLLARWLVTAVAIAVCSTPALLYGLVTHGLGTGKLAWIHGRPLVALPATLYGFVLGNAFVPAAWWWALTGMAAVLFGILVLRGVVARRAGRALLLWSLLLPLLAIIGASAVFNLYSEQSIRYLAFAQPFLLLLAARGWDTLRPRRSRVAALAAVAAVLAAGLTPLALLWPREGMGDHRFVAERVRQLAGEDDVVVADRLPGLPLAYELGDEWLARIRIDFPWRPSPLEGLLRDVPPRRLWLIDQYNRSMLEYIRAPHESGLTAPDPPHGYRLLLHEVVAGRKPISVALFERVDPGSIPRGGEGSPAAAGGARRERRR